MNDTYVTLQGWVGNEVDRREVRGATCASFRVGSTPRYRKDGEWVDGPTSWYTVNCWRTLGEHVAGSVRKGDAVVVHGRVRVDTWQRDGQPPSTSWFVDAVFVGHDLNRGTSRFAKGVRPARPEGERAVEQVLRTGEPPVPEASSAAASGQQPAEPAA
ncbi:MAG: single-stranded DNA-binding protein [Marmoricola sp.]